MSETPFDPNKSTMQALVYHGPGNKAWEAKPKPRVVDPEDAIVRVTTATICGTDLHILKGDLPGVEQGRILGHEGVGIIESIGAGVLNYKVGDKVIISCITSCGKCEACRLTRYSHCAKGGWILGYKIDGTQAEYVRIPYADNSLYSAPPGVEEEALVMLSDILPTSFECGVLKGNVKPGDRIAIIGAGPIGLAAVMTAQFYSPAEIIVVDTDENRLETARSFGATKTVNNSDGKAAEKVLALTEGIGVNTAIEAVGLPATFELCQEIVAVGGHIANIGVHGKPATLHLEKLWDHDVTITTKLVDTATIPVLLKVLQAGRLDARKLSRHRLGLNEIMKAYEIFGNAAKEKALKVVLKGE